MSTLNFIFLHGKPACGKDTQAEFLHRDIPGSKIVSGIYRSAIQSRGEFATFHDEIMPFVMPVGEGLKIPGSLLIEMLEHSVKEGLKDGISTFIFCGVVRKEEHLERINDWVRNLSRQDEVNVKHIYYELSDETALARSGVRLESSKKSGNERIDDKRDLIMNRIKRFDENVEPALKKLEEAGHLIKINAEDGIEDVYRRTKESLTGVASVEGVGSHAGEVL